MKRETRSADQGQVARHDHAAKRGGPKTPAGKAASRGNAVTHGLTSKKLIPDVLQRDRVATFRERLREQLQPASPLQHVLVDELARHAAMMELGEHAESAVLRRGATELLPIVVGTDREAPDEDDQRDALLSAAVATEAIDRLSRYRRGHEKAFYTALTKLQELQRDDRRRNQERMASPLQDHNAQRRPCPSSNNWHMEDNVSRVPQGSQLRQGVSEGRANQRGDPHADSADQSPFATEEACAAYLRQRFEHTDWNCPRCGHAQGHWLAARNCWQCAACRRQAGLRSGTVMQRSPLPLVTWFAAIRWVGSDPEIPVAELSEAIGIRRSATVRSMRRKIRRALAAEDATSQLAGLDQLARPIATSGR